MYSEEVGPRFLLGSLCLVAVAGCGIDASALAPDDAAGMDTSVLRDAGPDTGRPDTGLDDTGADVAVTDASFDADSRVAADATPDAPPTTCTTTTSGVGVMVALPVLGAIALDGDLTEWSHAQFTSLTPASWRDRAGPAPTDSADLSVRVAVLWTSTDLYIAAEVTDDTHYNASTGWNIWEGDSIQVAFDVAHDGGTPYDVTDDFEYGWAETTSGTERFRWVAPTAAPLPTDTVVVDRSGTTTTYESRIGAGDLAVAGFTATDRFGFSWIINEMDDAGSSEGFVEWTSGIGYAKDPSLFGDLLILDCD